LVIGKKLALKPSLNKSNQTTYLKVLII